MDRTRRSRKRIREAKEKCRAGKQGLYPTKKRRFICLPCVYDSELNEEGGWTKCGYLQRFDASPSVVRDCVRRESVAQLSEREFIERYERPAFPVVITGVTKSWTGARKWTPQVES